MDKNIITLSEEDIHYIVKEILNEGRLARFLGTAALGGALALGGGVPAQAQKPKIPSETLQYFIVDNPQEWEKLDEKSKEMINTFLSKPQNYSIKRKLESMAFEKKCEHEMEDLKMRIKQEKENAEKRDSIDSRIGDNKVLVNDEPIDVNNLINLLNNKFNLDGYTVETNINNNYTVLSKGYKTYENQQSLNININYSNVIKTNFSKEKMKDMFKHFRDDTIWHWNDIIKYEETTNGILISMPNKYNGIKYYTKIYLKDTIFKIEISVSTNLPIGWYNKHNISIERLEQIKTISEKCINALTGKERYDTEWDF